MITSDYEKMMELSLALDIKKKVLEGKCRQIAIEKAKVYYGMSSNELEIIKVVGSQPAINPVMLFPIIVIIQDLRPASIGSMEVIVLDRDEVIDADLEKLKEKWSKDIETLSE